jgi:hypothetical protein
MYFGVYLCLGGLFIILSIVLVPIVRQRLARFVVLSIISIVVGLASFELSSVFFNIINYRTPGNFNYPADYLVSGPIGLLIMILPILGITSPLIISYYLRSRKASSN